MQVVKRDGSRQEFNDKKIFSAVSKANSKVEKEKRLTEEQISKVVETTLKFLPKKEDVVSVELIHESVENALMKLNFFDTAKQYIRYREDRDRERFKKYTIIKEMEEKLAASNVQNQNANLDEESFGGRKGEMDSAFLKEYALNYCIKPKFARNHKNNRIYIHDLDSYTVGQHNCFNRETRFITERGIKAFREFSDGDVVKVLAEDGVFRNATIRYYGKKPMFNIVFSFGQNKEKTVICTRDHRWYLKDGTVTTSIEVGDTVLPLAENTISSKDVTSTRDAEMFAFGFTIGDGCDHGNFLQVRLCGNKMQYKHILEKASFKGYEKLEENGDQTFVKKSEISKQSFLTNKMWNILSFRDKQMLFAGYFAADGSNSKQKTLSTSDERCVEMVHDISALSGYHINSKKTIVHDTNFKKGAVLYTISFITHQAGNYCWKVKSITRNPSKDQEAWCLEEPVTRSFVLENGLITGNCLSVPMDELLENGFKTKQVDIRPAGSANTAFQLLAVIFQIQSLQQFGGVAATHLDWTMVPYVRKSFFKHFKDGLKYVEGMSDKEIKEFEKHLLEKD